MHAEDPDRDESQVDAACRDGDSAALRDRFVRRVVVGHVATFAIVFTALIYGVPKLERIYRDFDLRLPRMTQSKLEIARWFGDHWFVPLAIWGAGIGCIVLLDRLGKRAFARTLSRLWLFGVLLFLAFLILASFLPLVELLQKFS